MNEKLEISWQQILSLVVKRDLEESESRREGGNAPHTLTNSHTLLNPNQSLILNFSSNPSVIRTIAVNTSSTTNIIARAIFTTTFIVSFTITNRMYNSNAIILKVHSMNLL